MSALRPKSAVYQWHATRRQALVEQAWRESGLLVHQVVIWVKPHGLPGHSHFMWQTEPCFYGWVEGQSPKRPPSNVTNVWEVDHRSESMGIHLTQKPVELFLRPIEYHTEVNDIVYEPFSGSGTQIIAAERLGRRCFASEIDPHYASVAIARWEAFSGGTATKVE